MRTINQRELRNENASIIREVSAGESFTVLRHGTPIARLVPIDSDTNIAAVQKATEPIWTFERRHRSAPEPTATILATQRDDQTL